MADGNEQLLESTVDVGQIDSSEWSARSLPPGLDGRRDGFQVLITADAMARIHAQGKANPKTEVGGVLVGNVYRDAHGPYLWIDTILEGREMRHHMAQVTFTAETWADIQRRMDQDHPEDRIVGWYHTHPGFGIFLSEMDLFIQNNFFNLPWQTALVYDPKSDEEGVFNWHDGKPTRDEFLMIDDPGDDANPRGAAASDLAHDDAGARSGPEELACRLRELEHRQRVLDRQTRGQIAALRRKNHWLFVGLLFVLSFTLAWSMLILTLLPHSLVEQSGLSPATRPAAAGMAAAPTSVSLKAASQ